MKKRSPSSGKTTNWCIGGCWFIIWDVSYHVQSKTKIEGDGNDDNIVNVVAVTFRTVKKNRRLAAAKKAMTTLSLPSLLQ
jgi:hypothetical protein